MAIKLEIPIFERKKTNMTGDVGGCDGCDNVFTIFKINTKESKRHIDTTF